MSDFRNKTKTVAVEVEESTQPSYHWSQQHRRRETACRCYDKLLHSDKASQNTNLLLKHTMACNDTCTTYQKQIVKCGINLRQLIRMITGQHEEIKENLRTTINNNNKFP